MKHKARVTNHVADALSRMSHLLVTMHIEVLSFDSFYDLLTTDLYFSKIIQDVQDGQKSDFLLQDGFLFRGNQLCIPDCSLRL